jgi:pyruvate dehydrogenase E1 component beta subunit
VGAQHSQDFTAWYSSVPGLIVIAPYFAHDCKALLKSAIQNPNPVVFLENELNYGLEHESIENDQYIAPDGYAEIGKARIVREGGDLTIVGYSRMMHLILSVLPELEAENIHPEIIDLRTIRPIDSEAIIKSVKKTNKILIVDESWPFCSVASEIVALVNQEAFDFLDCPPLKINAKDVPLPYAANLEKLALPSKEEIKDAVIKLFNNRI